ncbi:MAG: hypothetical protein CVT92_07965 [Bacteroidetes bacterium HGW-Bacteroidetes-1]|jgi:hypothetical protein|nr:MAG: hypothetical protein CVT92_07965 [Bacteroidetes bacterium HGW-Bacteroidetes-1]
MNNLRATFKGILFVFFLLLAIWGKGQSTSQQSVCLNNEEMKLAEKINTFRKQNRLPEIVLSLSLSFVAKTHVADLQLNKPDTSICSTASWSDKGKWTPCCYNSYVLKNACMWDKPKEITSYPYRGYELSYYEEGIVDVDSVFQLWKSTNEVADMLLSQFAHSDKKWLAMGIGISENYVSVWLGQRNDPAGKPSKCNKENETIFQPTFADTLKKEIISENSAKYYLIYGSFTNKADANEAIKRYRNAGMKNVQLLVKEGRFRVALDVFIHLKDAIAAKEKLHPSYPEAWIYKE